MVSWPTLPTYSATNIPTASQLNLLNDAQNFLHAPLLSSYEEATDSIDYTTTSPAGTWVALSSTNYQRTITTSGGYVLVLFSCVSSGAAFTLFVDGVNQGDANLGSGYWPVVSSAITINIPFFFPALSAASHTFEIKWCRVGALTGTVFTKYRPRIFVVGLRGG